MLWHAALVADAVVELESAFLAAFEHRHLAVGEVLILVKLIDLGGNQ